MDPTKPSRAESTLLALMFPLMLLVGVAEEVEGCCCLIVAALWKDP